MRVLFQRKGPVLVMKTSGEQPIILGRDEYREVRWIITPDILELLRKENPGVDFVEDSR